MNERKKILVIEDHDSIRLLLGRFLSKQFDVVTKEDGFEALVWLSNGNIPDLILLDLGMPRISGLDFLANIRGSGFFCEIPVIVVSAEETQQLQKKCHEYNIVSYLTKPFNPLKLKDTIAEVLQVNTGNSQRARS